MEALLNTLWLVVALISAWRGALPRRVAVRASRDWQHCLLALACLVLVFPLISISDDLQYHEVAIEDSDCNCPQGKVVKPAECKSNVHCHHHAAAVALLAWWRDPEWRVAGAIRRTEVQPYWDVPALSHSGRAPPPCRIS